MNASNAIVPSAGVREVNIRFYQDYGYLIAPGLLTAPEIEELKHSKPCRFSAAIVGTSMACWMSRDSPTRKC